MGEQVSRVPKQANDDVLTVVPISFVACGCGFAHRSEIGCVVVRRNPVPIRRLIETVSRHLRRRMRRAGVLRRGQDGASRCRYSHVIRLFTG